MEGQKITRANAARLPSAYLSPIMLQHKGVKGLSDTAAREFRRFSAPINVYSTNNVRVQSCFFVGIGCLTLKQRGISLMQKSEAVLMEPAKDGMVLSHDQHILCKQGPKL